MKLFTTQAVAAIALLVSTAAQAQTYDLIYNANDGSLTIETHDQLLYVYSIFGPDDTSINDGFIQENHTQIPGNPGQFGDPLYAFTSMDGELSDTNRTGWLLTDPASLGSVLPTGLTQPQLDDAISSAWYVNAYGSTGAPSSFNNFNIVLVPEPTSLVLLVAGGTLICRRRRRG